MPCCDGVSERFAFACGKLRALVVATLFPLLCGVICGGIPVGVLTKWMAEEFVVAEYSSGEQSVALQIIPLRWPVDSVQRSRHISYLIFCIVRASVVALGLWGGYIPLVINGQGARTAAVSVLCLATSALFTSVFLRLFLYSTGRLVPSTGTEIIAFSCMAFSATFVAAVAIILAIPSQHRRRAWWPCAKIVVFAVSLPLVLNLLSRRALTSSGQLPRMFSIWILIFLRSCVLHAVLHASMDLPEITEEARLFLNILPYAGATGVISLLQILSSSSALVVFMYLNIIVSEVLKNGSMLKGRTDLETTLSAIRYAVRKASGANAKTMTTVVPASEVSEVNVPSPVSSEASEHTSTVTETGYHMMKQELLIELVQASNIMEFVIIFAATSLAMVVPISPGGMNGEALSRAQLFQNLLIGVMAELLSDFLTLASCPNSLRSMYRANFFLSARRPYLILGAICFMSLLVVNMAFTAVVIHMCPVMDAVTKKLKSLSTCV